MVKPQVLQQSVAFFQIFFYPEKPLGVVVEVLFVIFDGCLQIVKVEQVVFGQIVETHAHCLEILYLCPLGKAVTRLNLWVIQVDDAACEHGFGDWTGRLRFWLLLCLFLRRSLCFLLQFQDPLIDECFNGFLAIIVSKPAGSDGAFAVFWEVAPTSPALSDYDVMFPFQDFFEIVNGAAFLFRLINSLTHSAKLRFEFGFGWFASNTADGFVLSVKAVLPTLFCPVFPVGNLLLG